jgi:hypothetical protein
MPKLKLILGVVAAVAGLWIFGFGAKEAYATAELLASPRVDCPNSGEVWLGECTPQCHTLCLAAGGQKGACVLYPPANRLCCKCFF